MILNSIKSVPNITIPIQTNVSCPYNLIWFAQEKWFQPKWKRMKTNEKRKKKRRKKKKHWHFDLLADKKVNELIWYCIKRNTHTHTHTQWQINGKLFTQLLQMTWCRWTCTKYPAKCTIIYLYAYEQWQNFRTTNDTKKDKRMRNGILLMIFVANSTVSIVAWQKERYSRIRKFGPNTMAGTTSNYNSGLYIYLCFFFFLVCHSCLLKSHGP